MPSKSAEPKAQPLVTVDHDQTLVDTRATPHLGQVSKVARGPCHRACCADHRPPRPPGNFVFGEDLARVVDPGEGPCPQVGQGAPSSEGRARPGATAGPSGRMAETFDTE